MSKFLVALVALFLTSSAYSGPRVYRLGVTMGEIINNHDPMAPDIESKDWTTAFQWRVGLNWGRWYMDNNIHYESAFKKITTVGWEFENGIILGPVDIAWQHHSRHTADRQNGYMSETRYPLFDAVVVRLNIIEEPRRKR